MGLSPWLRLTRPFTLVPPAVGVCSGSLIALAVLAPVGGGFVPALAAAAPAIGLGSLCAAVLNAASNVLNQLTELELDRRNKPQRPLPRGELSRRQALAATVVGYALAAVLALAVPLLGGSVAFAWCMAGAAAATLLYSLKPPYLKARGFLANLTIAVPRGLLLKLAGWACVAPVLGSWEPWWIGLVFFCFLLVASSTKDLGDEAGDRAAGVRTWVVAAGRERVLAWMALGFVAPWALLPLGAVLELDHAPVLSLPLLPTLGFALALMAYGGWIAWRMRRACAGTIDGNHRSWTHMYLLMMVSQFGLAGLYLAT